MGKWQPESRTQQLSTGLDTYGLIAILPQIILSPCSYFSKFVLEEHLHTQSPSLSLTLAYTHTHTDTSCKLTSVCLYEIKGLTKITYRLKLFSH